jgi:hypothetical protein
MDQTIKRKKKKGRVNSLPLRPYRELHQFTVEKKEEEEKKHRKKEHSLSSPRKS